MSVATAAADNVQKEKPRKDMRNFFGASASSNKSVAPATPASSSLGVAANVNAALKGSEKDKDAAADAYVKMGSVKSTPASVVSVAALTSTKSQATPIAPLFTAKKSNSNKYSTKSNSSDSNRMNDKNSSSNNDSSNSDENSNSSGADVCTHAKQVKIKWKRNRFTFTAETLRERFSPLGDIKQCTINEKGNGALMTFSKNDSAVKAIEKYEHNDDMRVYEVRAPSPPEQEKASASAAGISTAQAAPPRTSERMKGPSPMAKCKSILDKIMNFETDFLHDTYQVEEGTTWFSEAVDPDKLCIPDYFDVIQNPMDLGTVKKKIDLNQYTSPEEFAIDVRLVFDNAMTYNKSSHAVYKAAEEISRRFEKDFTAITAVHPFFTSKESNVDKTSGNKRERVADSSSACVPGAKAVDQEGSKKAWGMLGLKQPKKEKGTKKKQQQQQQEIIDVDAEEQRDQEISARFKENLLKRKTDMAFATKSDNDDGTGKSVNPFFQKIELPEKSAKSSSSTFYVDLTKSSNLLTALTFPETQHVGVNVATCSKLNMAVHEYSYSDSKCLNKKLFSLAQKMPVIENKCESFKLEDKLVVDDLSLAVTVDLQRRKYFRADQPINMYANVFQTPTSIPSFTLRAMGSEFVPNCTVDHATCDEDNENNTISQNEICGDDDDIKRVQKQTAENLPVGPGEWQADNVVEDILDDESNLNMDVEERNLDEMVNVDSKVRKSLEAMSESSSCPSLVDIRNSLTNWLKTWTGTRSIKASCKKKRSSKWDSYSDDDDDSDLDDPTALAIIGPLGSGKTRAVHHCAKKLGMNVIEIGAGQLRSGSSVKKMIHEATQSHGLSGDRGKGVNLILFDEVDIVFEEDVGFYDSIRYIAKSSRSPIVLTSENDVTFLGNIRLKKLFSCHPAMPETLQILSDAEDEDEDIQTTVESEEWKVLKNPTVCTPVTMFCGNNIRSTKLSLKHPLKFLKSTKTNFSDFLVTKNLDICVFDSIEHVVGTKGRAICDQMEIKSSKSNSKGMKHKQHLKSTSFLGIFVPSITDVYPKWLECNFRSENIEGSWVRVQGYNFKPVEADVKLCVYLGEHLCQVLVSSDSLLHLQIPRECAVTGGMHSVSLRLCKDIGGKVLNSSSRSLVDDNWWIFIEERSPRSHEVELGPVWQSRWMSWRQTAVATAADACKVGARSGRLNRLVSRKVDSSSDDDNDDDDFVDSKPKPIQLISKKRRVIKGRVIDDDDDEMNDKDFQVTGSISTAATASAAEKENNTISQNKIYGGDDDIECVQKQTAENLPLGPGEWQADVVEDILDDESNLNMDVEERNLDEMVNVDPYEFTTMDPYIKGLLSVVNFVGSYTCAIPFFKSNSTISTFGIIGDSVMGGLYGSDKEGADVNAFIKDVRLVWANAIEHHTTDSVEGRDACFLSRVFDIEMRKMLASSEAASFSSVDFQDGNYSIVAPVEDGDDLDERLGSIKDIKLHTVDATQADIEALYIMSDAFDSLSVSDLLTSAAFEISHDNEEVKLYDTLYHDDIEELEEDEIDEETIAEKEKERKEVVVSVSRDEAVDMMRSLELLSGLANYQRIHGTLVMETRVKEWIDLNRANFPLRPINDEGSTAGDEDNDNSSSKCIYDATMTFYAEILTRANSMRYMYTNMRKGVLSNLVRDVICGPDSKEVIRMWKKNSLCLQKCLLFGLTREFAVDIFPAILSIISHEKRNFGKYDSGSAVASRGGRETRRSLVTMTQIYPYLNEKFPHVHEDVLNFMHKNFSLPNF